MKKYIIVTIFIFLLSLMSCQEDTTEFEQDDLNIEFVPGELLIGIKSNVDIKSVFDLINESNFRVDKINSLTFNSDLPSDSLEYILNQLNSKSYTNDGLNWFTTGYLHNQTKEIRVFPKLFEMENTDFQSDWLKSMDELELKQRHHPNLPSGTFLTYVPEGSELEWQNHFQSKDIIKWCELNYIAQIRLH